MVISEGQDYLNSSVIKGMDQGRTLGCIMCMSRKPPQKSMALLSRSCNRTTVYNNHITVYIVYIDSRQLYMYIYAAGPIHIVYGWSLSYMECEQSSTYASVLKSRLLFESSVRGLN